MINFFCILLASIEILLFILLAVGTTDNGVLLCALGINGLLGLVCCILYEIFER